MPITSPVTIALALTTNSASLGCTAVVALETCEQTAIRQSADKDKMKFFLNTV
jgi:hypothetical protein